MKITFLLSAYDRPATLWVSLGSLINQEEKDWECIVLDNNPDGLNRKVVDAIRDERIHYTRPLTKGCYHSSEVGAKWAKGDWLCFPSDDSYYCPEFIERMTEDGGVDLVYCNLLYDKRLRGRRAVLDVAPFECMIDKTCFIVKREKFIGFSAKDDTPNADGRAIEAMIRMGYRHRKVHEVLVVHN